MRHKKLENTVDFHKLFSHVTSIRDGLKLGNLSTNLVTRIQDGSTQRQLSDCDFYRSKNWKLWHCIPVVLSVHCDVVTYVVR